MKIEAKDRWGLVELRELRIGDCFSYDSKYYIITDEGDGNKTTVVNLATGQIDSFIDKGKVVPVEAKVVIE